MNTNRVISSLIYNEIENVFEKFNEYPYVHVKGEVLSLYAYGDFGKRHVGDIDLLIPRPYLKYVENILSKCGFSCTNMSRTDKITMLSTSQQIAPWRKHSAILKNRPIEVDLNFDIFWGEYDGIRIDIDEFIADYVEMKIYGCRLKALNPLKTMIQLILHHYNDMNSLFLLATRKSIPYNMFKDVYYLLINNLDEITINRLYDLSDAYGICPYVYYILYHTGLLFKDEVLKKYVSVFKSHEGEDIINCYGLHKYERREWKVDFITRVRSNNIYELIKDDMTEKDIEKIKLNKSIFMSRSV